MQNIQGIHQPQDIAPLIRVCYVIIILSRSNVQTQRYSFYNLYTTLCTYSSPSFAKRENAVVQDVELMYPHVSTHIHTTHIDKIVNHSRISNYDN